MRVEGTSVSPLVSIRRTMPLIDALDLLLADAALAGRDADRAGELVAVERRAPAVLLDHQQVAQLHPLEGGEARAAARALPAATDRRGLVHGPRILHLGVFRAAEWAAHATLRRPARPGRGAGL